MLLMEETHWKAVPQAPRIGTHTYEPSGSNKAEPKSKNRSDLCSSLGQGFDTWTMGLFPSSRTGDQQKSLFDMEPNETLWYIVGGTYPIKQEACVRLAITCISTIRILLACGV